MFSALRYLHPIRNRRMISAIMLVVAFGSGLVFSIPQRVVKDRSVPFPCMDCNCSCRNAEACWSGCGCMLPAQKLAWAIEKGIEPPAWFSRIVAADSVAESDVATSCCSTAKPIRSCCTAKESRSDAARAGAKDCDSESCQEDSCVTMIPAIGKRRCHGLDRLYVLLSMVLPIEQQSPLVVQLPTDRLGPVRSVSYQGLEASSLNRPPEQSSI
jgi:hypothetical protein